MMAESNTVEHDNTRELELGRVSSPIGVIRNYFYNWERVNHRVPSSGA